MSGTASSRRRYRLWLYLSLLLAMLPLLWLTLDKKEEAPKEPEQAKTDTLVPGELKSPTYIPEAKPDSGKAPEETSWWKKGRAQLRALLLKLENKSPDTVVPPLPSPRDTAQLAYVEALVSSSATGASSKAEAPDSVGKPAAADSLAVQLDSAPPSHISTSPVRMKDSVVLRGFVSPLSRPGVRVKGDLWLYSSEKGLSARFAPFAPTVEVALENIFYITQPENLKIPQLEAQILQRVGFVFPQGAVGRVELRHLHTEWDRTYEHH